MNIKEFRERIDNDEGLTSKRNSLVLLCVAFLAINLSGATLEEANTFIFRIVLENNKGLSLLIFSSIIFLTIRYYNYAQAYQAVLFNFVAARIMKDYRVFNYNPRDEQVYGHLGSAVTIFGGDEPGLRAAKYKVTGLLQRAIVYSSNGYEEDGEIFDYDAHINLNKFTEHWTFFSYIKLLIIEARYRIQAFFKHREYLDLLSPYILSILSIASFIFKDVISSFIQ